MAVRFLKTILRVLIVLALLCFLLAGGLYVFRNQIVNTAIKRGGTYALGTETSIDSTSWNLRTGQLVLFGLSIANPPGFDETPFFALGRIEVHYNPETILKRPVRIERILLDSVHLYLDKHEGQANYEAILNHIESLDSTAGERNEPKEKGPLIVDHLLLQDIHVSAMLLPIGGDLSRCNYRIEKIEIKHLGAENEESLSTAEVFSIVTKALFSSALQMGGNVLPGPIRNGLGFALTPVWNLGELGIDVAAFTVDGAVDVVSFMGKGVFSIGKGLGKGLVNIGKAMVPGGGDDSVKTTDPVQKK